MNMNTTQPIKILFFSLSSNLHSNHRIENCSNGHRSEFNAHRDGNENECDKLNTENYFNSYLYGTI